MRISDWSSDVCSSDLVENWSYSDRNVRVRIPVGIGYDSDLKLAQELMLRAAQESPRVLRNPTPNVWLTAFGENRVEHDILVWISDPESGVGNVKSDVLGRLWLLFREHGITIPYPQRVIHAPREGRSEEHTSELQSLMSISYAVFCLKQN